MQRKRRDSLLQSESAPGHGMGHLSDSPSPQPPVPSPTLGVDSVLAPDQPMLVSEKPLQSSV